MSELWTPTTLWAGPYLQYLLGEIEAGREADALEVWDFATTLPWGEWVSWLLGGNLGKPGFRENPPFLRKRLAKSAGVDSSIIGRWLSGGLGIGPRVADRLMHSEAAYAKIHSEYRLMPSVLMALFTNPVNNLDMIWCGETKRARSERYRQGDPPLTYDQVRSWALSVAPAVTA